MIHNRAGRKLKRTASHRKALLCNMASSLFQHKKISTTEAKAKELRAFAEQLITRAKHALQREQQGLLPQGQTIDIHNRREVYRSIRNKGVVQELFDTIAPAVLNRPGGYTRIVKLGTRRGDAGRIAMIELVDFSASRDGVIRLRRKKAAPKPAATVKPVAAPVAEAAAPIVEEVASIVEEVAPIVEAPVEVAEVAPAVEEAAPVEVVAEAAPAADETTAEEPSEPTTDSDESKENAA
jgi:large subunit ribosomal protein L17